MKVDKHTVVSLHYTLKNNDGNVLDTSQGGDPLVYLHGVGNLIPGLEKEINGKEEGTEFQATVPPEEAYGQRNEEFIKTVSKNDFQGDEELQVGMQVQIQSQSGEKALAMVSDIKGENVDLDLNHPLAGETLHFEVKIEGVRQATAEEIEHKHAHGPNGHQE